MKKLVNTILIVLIFISFASFVINGYIVFDEYTHTSSESMNIDENVYVSNSSSNIKIDENGINSEGEINILGMNVSYDTIFDDDDNNDGYCERRSYYKDGILVHASWDKNGDGKYDVYMNVENGLNIDTVYQDTNYDGIFDTEDILDENGEVIYSTEELYAYNGTIYADRPFDVFESSNMILCVLSFIIFMLLVVMRALLKKKNITNTLLLLLCCLFAFNYNSPITYASDIYNEDGTINNEVFETDWQKYSDLDDSKPLKSRSYEAQQYENSKLKTLEYYNQLYVLVNSKEVNRLEYIELKNAKETIVKTHKSNLIKSFIRLSVFSAIQIKDAVGNGSSFAGDILDEGATAVSRIGNIIDTTSNYVTDEYKDSFSNIQKTFSYVTADSILENLKDDVKSKVEEKITDTLDNSNLYYKVDDLKLSDEDFDILKSHYKMNRTLDNAILKNRNKDLEIKNKIEEINLKLIEEIANMEKYLALEKDRVYYLLSKKPPEEEEIPTLLGESFSDVMDDVTSEEHLDSVSFDNIDQYIEEEISIEETVEYSMIGDWGCTQTLLDVSIIGGNFTEEEKQEVYAQFENSDNTFNYTAVIKESDEKVVVLFGQNPDPYVLRVDGNNVTLTDNLTYSDNEFTGTLDFSFFGYVNDEKNYMDLTGTFDINISDNNGHILEVELEVKLELNKY